MFVRNLLGGESQKCFNCGLHQEVHKNRDDEENQEQQQQQQPDQENDELSGSESELEGLAGLGHPRQQGRPTIFTDEQRRSMIGFGRELGWSLWPHRSNPRVRTFCDSVGITRKQFRGWLHTNKHKYMDT